MGCVCDSLSGIYVQLIVMSLLLCYQQKKKEKNKGKYEQYTESFTAEVGLNIKA